MAWLLESRFVMAVHPVLPRTKTESHVSKSPRLKSLGNIHPHFSPPFDNLTIILSISMTILVYPVPKIPSGL